MQDVIASRRVRPYVYRRPPLTVGGTRIGASSVGDIEVQPEALKGLGQEVRGQVGEARGVASQAGGRGGVSTGVGALDTSLGGFARMWGQQVTELCGTGDKLAEAVDTAAVSYQRTDQAAVPSSARPGGMTPR